MQHLTPGGHPARHAWLVFSLSFLLLSGCYRILGSKGGGQTSFEPPRQTNPADVAVPAGYTVDAVATGLTFPTGVAFDENGGIYITESGYSYGEVFTTPRLLRVEPEGRLTEIAAGGRNGPWNGVDYGAGAFFVAEGGVIDGGRILRITRDGATEVLTDSLPSLGDHHTNGPAVGPDGWIYFGQGTATNSGIVGIDNYDFGWLERHPDFHDVPCQDVTLTGRNYKTDNPLTPERGDQVLTGAFTPFGKPTSAGRVVAGRVPCTGALLRVRPEGGAPELVAWGFRNPFGLAFGPEGDLYVTENGFDDRGSRPAWGTGDYLWRVEPGSWYGWPDFAGGVPLRVFDPPGRPAPNQLLAEHPNEPPQPISQLGVHSSSNGLAFSASDRFGYAGHAFVAQFGDMAPDVGKVLTPVGFQVVRVDPADGVVHGFAANHGKRVGPASWLGNGGLERPVAVRFSPDGSALYLVDFGVMTMGQDGPRPHPGTGVLWRITRGEAAQNGRGGL